jgi:hypothetical protein
MIGKKRIFRLSPTPGGTELARIPDFRFCIFEPNRGRQMHPLQLEQMLISQFSSSSDGRTTESLLAEYPSTLRPFRPNDVASAGK